MEQLTLNLDDPYQPDRTALNGLFLDSARYKKSAEYLRLLKYIARFSQYSPYNCMLLHIQNPEATYVATPNQWKKRFNRTVKPGARPLLILAPNCPIMFVYDLVDTEGEILPSPWQDPFAVNGKLKTSVWMQTMKNCDQYGIAIDPSANMNFLHAGTAFRLRTGNQIVSSFCGEPFDFLIAINHNLDLSSQYSTLVHELGHIFSGHLGSREGDWWKDRRDLDTSAEEIEAESISYLVCMRRGLQTKSAEYLARYSANHINLPPVDVDRILSVTYWIERMGEEYLPTRKNKRTQK
jgi:hypothetical protein